MAATIAAAGAPAVAGAEVLYGLFSVVYGGTLLTVDRATGGSVEVGSLGVWDPLALDCAPDGTLWGGLGDWGTGAIVTVDRATGAATLVGESGFPSVTALAVAPDGGIVASVESDVDGDALATVDPATGAATLVGPYGPGITGMEALAFDAAGTLHGVSNDALGVPALYTIDRTSGAATLLAIIEEAPGVPLTASVRGLAFAGDGTLLAVSDASGGLVRGPRSGVAASDLLVLDAATGALRSVVGTTESLIEALAVCDAAGGPRVFAVLPDRAGNRGSVDVVIHHDLVLPGAASVTLACGAGVEIAGAAVLVEPALHRIRTTVDLAGTAPGTCDVVVTDATDPANTATLPGGFTIADGSVAVLRVVPSAGGDAGPVTAVVQARNVAPGATVKLVRAGEEIVGTVLAVAPGDPRFYDPGTVTATFDLAGRTRGAWDVVVANPGDPGAPGTLPGAFVVQAATRPVVAFDLVGPAGLRVGIPTRWGLTARNTGNVDTTAVLGVAGIPPDAAWDVDMPPRLLVGATPNPQMEATPDGPVLFLPVMLLPPGVQRNVTLTLVASSEGTFQLRAILVQDP